MSLGRAARRVAGIAGAVSEASICSPATWRSAEAVAKVVVPEESVALSRIIAGASRATLRRAGKAAKDYVEKPAAEFRKSVVERAKKSYRKGVDAHLSDPAANPADAELAGIGRAVVDTGISNAKFYIKAQAKHAKSILLGGTAIGLAVAMAKDLGLDISYLRDPDQAVESIIGKKARSVLSNATSLATKGTLKTGDEESGKSSSVKRLRACLEANNIKTIGDLIVKSTDPEIMKSLKEALEEKKEIVIGTALEAPLKANTKLVALAALGPVADKFFSNIKRYTLDNDLFRTLYEAGIFAGESGYSVTKAAAKTAAAGLTAGSVERLLSIEDVPVDHDYFRPAATPTKSSRSNERG